MTRLSLAEVVPGAIDFGPISEKPDRMSGVYLGNKVVMTRLWTDHIFMASTNDMIVTPHLINRGVIEPHNSRTLVSLVKPGDTFVDVGANVGYFSILAAWRIHPGGEVWTFEPNIDVFRLLSDNLTTNGFGGMCRRHKVALSDRAGTATLRIFPGYEATSTIRDVPEAFLVHTERETGRTSHTVEVNTVRLDDAMHDVPRIDVMKIDAEGHELSVIRGAQEILGRSPDVKIVMEFVPTIMGFEEAASLLRLLRELGFRIFRIENNTTFTSQPDDDAILQFDFSDLLLVKRSA